MEKLFFLYITFLMVMMLLRLFFKVDRSYLFCGIFAFSPKKGLTEFERLTVLWKIKILGMYNESRGGQGAGLYLNGEIYKVADKAKTFPELLENNFFDIPNEDTLMMGHCRKSSRGIMALQNTHPHLIDDDMVFQHNGTIENIGSLMKDYNVETPGNVNDSFGLGTIIHRHGLDVLDKYKGYAALIWTLKSDPTKMYVFHGASRTYASALEPTEERPLFYMRTEEGMYFSSMKESLYAIRTNKDDEPESLAVNRVYTVEEGNFLQGVIVVKREDANVPPKVVHNQPASYSKGYYDGYDDDVYSRSNGWNNFPVKASKIGSQDEKHFEPLVWRERLPLKIITNSDPSYRPVYYHKGRFYQGLGKLCEGKMYIIKKGFVVEDTNPHGNDMYFIRGVLMRSQAAFEDAMDEFIVKRKFTLSYDNFAYRISKYSRYPVANLPSEGLNVSHPQRFYWYLDAKPAKVGFTAPFGGRHYMIKEGILKEIRGCHKGDKVCLYDTYKDAIAANPEDSENNVKISEIDSLKETPKKISLDKLAEQVTNAVNSFQEEDFIDYGDPFFDRQFNTYDEALRAMNTIHRNAMATYIILSAENVNVGALDYDAEESNHEVLNVITMAIRNKCTIREQLLDKEDNLSILIEEATRHMKREQIAESYDVNVTDVEIDDEDAIIDMGIEILDDSIAENVAKHDIAMESPENTVKLTNEEFHEVYGYCREENVRNAYSPEYAKLIESEEAEERAKEEDEEELEQQEYETERELKEANNLVEDSIDILNEFYRKADELQANESNFAQHVACSIYQSLTNLKHSIADHARIYSTQDMVENIAIKVN